MINYNWSPSRSI